MAERDPPPPASPPPPPPPPPAAPLPELNPAAQAAAQAQTPRGSGTYIVQIPKDQIYRVPPPENAYLAERHRKPGAGRRPRCCCRGCACWFVVALVLAALLVAAAAAAAFIFLARPTAAFSVERFLVRRGATARYALQVGVRNPSSISGVDSPGGGSAVLSYGGHRVATGKMPSFSRAPGGQGTIMVKLSSAKAAQLPAEVKRSLEGKKAEGGGLTMSLEMEFPVKKKVWGQGNARVGCSVRVSTLAAGKTKVLQQSCQFAL